MIKAIIIEDEKPALERIMGFVKQIPDIEVIATTNSGKDAAQKIDTLQPDLIFLDIHLQDLSGIDMLLLISHKPAIIFTTAYNQYAIKAFDFQAIDYLIKPFSRQRLELAVKRVRNKLSSGEDSFQSIKELLSSWRPGQEYLRRIPSKVGEKIYILTDDEIVYFASENKLLFAHTSESKFLINYRFEDLQSRLDPEKFFRIHRSSIVNLNYVKLIESWFAGGYKVKVRDKNNTELDVSRSAGKLLRYKMGW